MQKEVTLKLNIDFNELKQQKLALIQLANKRDITDYQDAIEGLICLIDGIQDHVVDTGQLDSKDVYIKVEKTEEAYEEYLNELYNESWGRQAVLETHEYLTNPSRGAHISKAELMSSYAIGTLVRKLDPIRFQTGYNDWNP